MVVRSAVACRVCLGVALAALAVGACRNEQPTSPDVLSAPGSGSRASASSNTTTAVANAGANVPPNAVFKTRPAAGSDGVIAVGEVVDTVDVFDVTFNMCASTDPDPGDDLGFTFDFDGDGAVDYYGHCRATHRYSAADLAACRAAVVCVRDRQPDHVICNNYSVCPIAPRAPQQATSTNQSVQGSHPPGAMDVYSFTATAGTTLQIRGDTVAAATAYDLYIRLSTTPDNSGFLANGDDDWACTFPPPSFGCPDFPASIPTTGTYYLLVSEAANSYAGAIGEYAATIVASQPISSLSQVSDNVPFARPPQGKALSTQSRKP
jgi:hypothetical protein